MNIVWICSECRPYVKTGGLADVSASLSSALAKRGHQVTVIIPFYRQVMGELSKKFQRCRQSLEVPFGELTVKSAIYQDRISDNLSFYFIESEHYFDRPGIYDEFGQSYPDNAERFIFFSRAAMQAVPALGLKADILHCNDWHSALCCVYLKDRLYRENPSFSNCRSVLTIHNIGYQGICDKNLLNLTGLGWKYFNIHCLEFYDQLNLLKGGIMTADMVNTVSPTNAAEIMSAEYGFGLEHALQHQAAFGRLRGILNGIDDQEWNPESDPLIPRNYSSRQKRGKTVCKRVLQQELGLEPCPKTALIGIVTRLVHQKGIDILADALPGLLKENIQWVIIGSGDLLLEERLRSLAAAHPQKLGVFTGYSERLAHLTEAGSDMFIMPSRYEPCGLNQMYSMRYGSVPIVRATGGLEDSVENYEIYNRNTATGFKFWDLTVEAIQGTVKWAVSVYYNERAAFNRIRTNGMNKNFSWKHTAREYEVLYEDTHR